MFFLIFKSMQDNHSKEMWGVNLFIRSKTQPETTVLTSIEIQNSKTFFKIKCGDFLYRQRWGSGFCFPINPPSNQDLI